MDCLLTVTSLLANVPRLKRARVALACFDFNKLSTLIILFGRTSSAILDIPEVPMRPTLSIGVVLVITRPLGILNLMLRLATNVDNPWSLSREVRQALTILLEWNIATWLVMENILLSPRETKTIDIFDVPSALTACNKSLILAEASVAAGLLTKTIPVPNVKVSVTVIRRPVVTDRLLM